ncbi:hypothetical protein LR48_Vigan08g099700 [Vigna angularis]|uniref:Uncharacterized protein n=1 Tax=Phaseolus angularis TaxID=3914 RepID=A0A0L9V501_PHAAN|nr:hypothetical protein LR48_Vigan08g099700 [Vigna angularis]
MTSSSGKRIKTLDSKEKETKRKEKEQGEQVLLRTLMSAFPERQFMSQDEFVVYVAWPADLAQEGDRAEATTTSAIDVDDDDSDEE